MANEYENAAFQEKLKKSCIILSTDPIIDAANFHFKLPQIRNLNGKRWNQLARIRKGWQINENTVF